MRKAAEDGIWVDDLLIKITADAVNMAIKIYTTKTNSPIVIQPAATAHKRPLTVLYGI